MQILTKNCIVCGNEYTKKPFYSKTTWSESKYCSRTCLNQSKVGRIAWNRGRSDTGFGKNPEGRYDGPPWNKGIKGIHISPSSEFKKGHIPWHNGTKGVKKQRPWTLEERKKMADDHRGSKSHLWKGGVSKINHIIRQSLSYRVWRTSVFQRDDFTCQSCGVRGGKLNADHIKPFHAFPELRLELSNGRTLCVPCHRQTDTYAKNFIR